MKIVCPICNGENDYDEFILRHIAESQNTFSQKGLEVEVNVVCQKCEKVFKVAPFKEIKEKEDFAIKGEKLIKIVEDFVDKQKISCPETIYQSDRVILNAYKLIEKLCNVVGYFKYDEDEEED